MGEIVFAGCNEQDQVEFAVSLDGERGALHFETRRRREREIEAKRRLRADRDRRQPRRMPPSDSRSSPACSQAGPSRRWAAWPPHRCRSPRPIFRAPSSTGFQAQCRCRNEARRGRYRRSSRTHPCCFGSETLAPSDLRHDGEAVADRRDLRRIDAGDADASGKEQTSQQKWDRDTAHVVSPEVVRGRIGSWRDRRPAARHRDSG